MYHFYGLEAAPTASMPGQPPPTPAPPPAIAAPADAAHMPVINRHHSKDMMQPSSVKRDSNVPSLDSGKVKFRDADSNKIRNKTKIR